MATIGAAELYGLPVSTTHVLSSGVAGTMVANRSGLGIHRAQPLNGLGAHAARLDRPRRQPVLGAKTIFVGQQSNLATRHAHRAGAAHRTSAAPAWTLQ